MKKRIYLVLSLLLVSFAAYSQPVSISAGVGIAWFPGVYENQTVTDTLGVTGLPAGTELKNDYSYSAFGIRGFFDFTYVAVSVGYRGAISKLTVKSSALSISASADADFSISLVELRLLGKYPFVLGSTWTIFPLIGIESTICVAGKAGTLDFTDTVKSGYSDISLLLGVGSDIKVAQQVFLRPDLIFGINLTAKREDAFYSGVTYKSASGFFVQLGLAVGFNL